MFINRCDEPVMKKSLNIPGDICCFSAQNLLSIVRSVQRMLEWVVSTDKGNPSSCLVMCLFHSFLLILEIAESTLTLVDGLIKETLLLLSFIFGKYLGCLLL